MQTPMVVKIAWKPLLPLCQAAAFVDVGHRFSSSVRRAATSNTLTSAFQGGHPILTQWVSPLVMGAGDEFSRNPFLIFPNGLRADDGLFAESFGGRWDEGDGEGIYNGEREKGKLIK
ncbi:hypothetical protein V6N12_010933 [Hibiscus sabdariffa]|uniref:Uncharacterized protein n=1 Tax=Hibiscus sabdariffa TaxID=183260 RepID=A0ABR2ELJ1_9ROSI